ncbi:MAG: Dna2/Cas4 domain-containing protein, partial [Bacteroidales bacterium]|nr:Dna2/Cas4 domain-containing protein [Bacteroidales bacterium]
LLERADPKTNRVVEVNVIDFKTEHLNDDDYDPRYRDSMFQVRLYALATQSQLPVTTRAGYIHYLSEGVRREVVVNDIVLHQIREDVKSKVRKIMSRNFTPVCNPVICNKCDRRNLCRHSAA